MEGVLTSVCAYLYNALETNLDVHSDFLNLRILYTFTQYEIVHRCILKLKYSLVMFNLWFIFIAFIIAYRVLKCTISTHYHH